MQYLLSLLVVVVLTAGCPSQRGLHDTDMEPGDGGWNVGGEDIGGADAGTDPGADAGARRDMNDSGDAGPPSWASCMQNDDCTLRVAGCCAPCGAPTLEDVDGVHVDSVDEHRQAVCPSPMACPRCPTAPNPELFATCSAGACEARDLARLPQTECTEASDCRPRTRTCCECTDVRPDTVVALRRDSVDAYTDEICPPAPICDDCVPTYDGYAVDCVEGRCQVVDTP
jgi:hypothetical protein